MNCQKCKQPIIIQPKHKVAGEFKCFKCGYTNKLVQTTYYDESIFNSLKYYGELVNTQQSHQRYSLKNKVNIIGRNNSCNTVIERIEHDGKCYISGKHCTISVEFDIWKGRLRYKIIDGVSLDNDNTIQSSTNGTYVNQYKLKQSENLDIPEGGTINLGGMDEFTLEPYVIPETTLESYKKSIDSNNEIEITE